VSLSLTYPAAGIDVNQLHDELLRAGLIPEYVGQGDVVADEGTPEETRTPTVFLTMPDGTVEGDVDAVVAAHVPQARYAPPALLAARAPLLRESRRRADLTRLRRATAGATTVDALRAATAGVLDFLEREGAQAE
jgi:hypothetical protein